MKKKTDCNLKRLIQALSVILVICIIFTIIPHPTASADDYGINEQFLAPIIPIETLADFGDYIEINDRAGLEAISSNLGGKYYLSADIDLSDGDWSPIGVSSPFTGVFDGQGHCIHYMTITGEIVGGSQLYSGIFARIQNGVVRNTGLEEAAIDVYVTTATITYTGGVCGSAVSSEIINCYCSGLLSSSTTPDSYNGGICGYAHYSMCSYCYNTATIQSNSNDSASYAAGVCGILIGDSETGMVNACYNSGSIISSSANNDSFVGGICGSLSSEACVSYSFNTGASIKV